MRCFCLLLSAAVVLSAQAPPVEEHRLRAHLAYLSDDLLEGRGTGQRGGDLTVKYLETQLQSFGLRPVAEGTFLQKIRLLGVQTLKARTHLAFKGAKGDLVPVLDTDTVVIGGLPRMETPLDAPLVFVGYGIEAPEEHWNDFKGADVKGKLLVMLVNEPKPTAAEPALFWGTSLSYYGRWTYKFQQARRHGAAGVLLIHSDEGASYGWSVVRNSWAGERFQPAPEGDGNPIQGWISGGFTTKLFLAAGMDLAALRAAAERREFRPVELSLRLEGILRSTVREVEQYNVAGLVPGTDPVLREEALFYSAHWDHFGKEDGPPARIYNGALDNGSGCAALLVMAQAAALHPTPRTQVFFFPCGEEQGLLGSEGYIRQPFWPLQKTAAYLNLDMLNFVGPTKDISLFGAERTTLLETGTRVAKDMGLTISEESADTAGSFFRSDHFSFAKAGVPAFSIAAGRLWTKNPAASSVLAQAYASRYHQTTDRYDPAWDLSGMVQQAQYTFNLGYVLAAGKERPVWKKGAELPKIAWR
jgi:Zn-dependent M28 family amino/carboxypeptidase